MNWEQFHEEHAAVAQFVCESLRPDIEQAAARIVETVRAGGKVMVCGNGGSAADAQHMAGEFINRFLREREPYAAVALSTDTSVITAIANDYDYESIFKKQVEALGRPGDLLIAISTSGGAANCCAAVEAARERGVHTLVMTGGTGGRLAPLADQVLSVSCTKHTPRIQEGHEMMMHILCELMEEQLCEGSS